VPTGLRPGDRLIVFTTFADADRVRDYFSGVKALTTNIEEDMLESSASPRLRG
jgi:hypothetical protein